MKIDPEFKKLLFPLTDEEYIELEESLVKFGCRKPLDVWEGILVDGHNRYEICNKLRIPFKTQEIKLKDRDEAKLWIIRNQFARRNLNKYQRSQLALKMKPIIQEQAKIKQVEAGGAVPQKSVKAVVDTQKELAKHAGVSHDTIHKVEVIQRDASYEDIEKLESGEKSINSVYGHIKAREKFRKIENRKEEIKTNLESELKTIPIVSRMDCNDFINHIEEYDLLLTDPPYMTDIEDIEAFAKSWLPNALSKVKNTGSAYIFIGAYPEEVKAYLNCVTPTQILIWEYKNTLGNNPKKRYKQNYQMVLYYRMPDTPDLNIDIINEQWAVHHMNAPDGRLGDRYHTWQKPLGLAERFISLSTKEGDLVVDPFCCTGTFLLAASKCGRNAIGSDISEKNLKIAIHRGCKYDGQF